VTLRLNFAFGTLQLHLIAAIKNAQKLPQPWLLIRIVINSSLVVWQLDLDV